MRSSLISFTEGSIPVLPFNFSIIFNYLAKCNNKFIKYLISSVDLIYYKIICIYITAMK